MTNQSHAVSVTRTLRPKVKSESEGGGMSTGIRWLLLFLPGVAWAEFDLGYSTMSIRGIGLASSTTGLEARAVVNDRWAFAVGHVKAKPTRDGWFCFRQDCRQLGEMPSYSYVTFTHRWTWRLLPNLIAYLGSGLIYRDAQACLDSGEARKFCADGDFAVSSKIAFHQEGGFLYGGKRAAVDLSIGHASTGGWSVWNRGEDFERRLGLFARFGRD